MKYSAYSRLAADDEPVATLPIHVRALEGLRRRDPVMARAGIIQDCCNTCEYLLQILAAPSDNPGIASVHPMRLPQAGAFARLVAPRCRGRPPKKPQG
jgi:hypothetical protein